MDDVDRRIIALLRENARRSFQDIGQHVHLSAPAVKRRLDRLERDGVVLGYTAIIDPQAFGANYRKVARGEPATLKRRRRSLNPPPPGP